LTSALPHGLADAWCSLTLPADFGSGRISIRAGHDGKSWRVTCNTTRQSFTILLFFIPSCTCIPVFLPFSSTFSFCTNVAGRPWLTVHPAISHYHSVAAHCSLSSRLSICSICNAFYISRRNPFRSGLAQGRERLLRWFFRLHDPGFGAWQPSSNTAVLLACAGAVIMRFRYPSLCACWHGSIRSSPGHRPAEPYISPSQRCVANLKHIIWAFEQSPTISPHLQHAISRH